MRYLWNDSDELAYISRYRGKYRHRPDIGEETLRQAYATTLLGADSSLAMHGGGNTSIKLNVVDAAGEEKRALYVKATGTPLCEFDPDHFVAMDLAFLEGMKPCGAIDDAAMAREFTQHRLIQTDLLPSIESLMHAFIGAMIVDHTHPEALLKIANRVGGAALLAQCFGDDLAVIPYARMGYDLASAVMAAAQRNPKCKGAVIIHHGLVVWGDSARQVYGLTIDIVNRAESFLASMPSKPIARGAEVSAEASKENYRKIAPLIREALYLSIDRNEPAGLCGIDIASAVDKMTLILLNTPDVMELINSPDAAIVRELPLTPDYPMPRRILPLWLDIDLRAGADKISSYIDAALDEYVKRYSGYLEKRGVLNQGAADLLPGAVVHPQIGAVCVGTDEASALSAADFVRQAFSIRREIAESGGEYQCLSDEYVFDMRYRNYQSAK